MQEKYYDLSLFGVFVVQFVVMLAADGFVVAVPQCKLIAGTYNVAVCIKTQVVGRQLHTAVNLTWGIHAVQFGTNLDQAT